MIHDYALPFAMRRIKARRRRAFLREAGAGLGFAVCLFAAGVMVTPTGAQLLAWLLEVVA